MSDSCKNKTQFQSCYLYRELGYRHLAEVQNSESSTELFGPLIFLHFSFFDSCGHVPSDVGGALGF